MTRHVVIAIDGPAASGKSSTAKWVAERLGMRHVDSGALYRAATAACLRQRGSKDPSAWTEGDVLKAARDHVTLVPAQGGFEPHIDGAQADVELRGAGVTAHVSAVARMDGVRSWVNALVREAAGTAAVVVDGRDMGTAVFPDANLKVF